VSPGAGVVAAWGWVACLALAFGSAAAQAPLPLDEGRALLEYERNTVDIMRAYGPSVVTVSVEIHGRRVAPLEGLPDDQVPPQFRDGPPLPPQLQQGTGSGFVIDGDAIVTSYHVIRAALLERSVELREGARLAVRFPGVDEAFPVRVAGANALYDLALLVIVEPAALPAEVRARPPLPLGDSDSVVPGQKAIAIGHPFGFEGSVTVGTVSGVARRLVDVGQADLPFIQTDTAINPGNSGGPLLDSRAQVIGVNTAILPGSGSAGQRGFIGLGFAVPSNILREHLDELRTGGWVDIESRPRLGVSVIGLDVYPDAVRDALGLPSAGVMVIEVEPGGPAAAAGLQGATSRLDVGGRSVPVGGDVVISVDGVAVVTAGDLQRLVLARADGQTLALRLQRSGEVLEVDVPLGRVPR
jgi:serine protease Do